MRKLIAISIAALYCLPAISQNVSKEIPRPTGDTVITAYDDHTEGTVYAGMQRLLNGVQPISYIAPLPQFDVVERIRPLRFGEGVNGYIIEGWIDQTFTLLQGRSQMDHFAQTSRVSFRYAPALRMTRDNSSNLLPTNQRVGIQIDKVLWDNHTNIIFRSRRNRFKYVTDTSWYASTQPFQMVHASFNALHYSNGQAEGVYNPDYPEDSIIKRNDYLKGDFSTNILNFSLIYSYYDEYLFSASLGYQRDSHWGGPFEFIDEQRGRYGMDRIIGYLQFRSKPVRSWFKKEINVKDVYHDKAYRVKRLVEHRLRFDFEYILGKLDEFNRSKDYRFNAHLFYELSSLRSRTAGIIFHIYYGRDYMNIRYDDIVFAAMVGVSFSLTKYRHPRFNAKAQILGPAEQARYEEKQQKMEQRRLQKSN